MKDHYREPVIELARVMHAKIYRGVVHFDDDLFGNLEWILDLAQHVLDWQSRQMNAHG